MKGKWLKIGGMGILTAALTAITFSSAAFAAAPPNGLEQGPGGGYIRPESGPQESSPTGALEVRASFRPGPQEGNLKSPRQDGPMGPRDGGPKDPWRGGPMGPREDQMMGPQRSGPRGPQEGWMVSPQQDGPTGQQEGWMMGPQPGEPRGPREGRVMGPQPGGPRGPREGRMMGPQGEGPMMDPQQGGPKGPHRGPMMRPPEGGPRGPRDGGPMGPQQDGPRGSLGMRGFMPSPAEFDDEVADALGMTPEELKEALAESTLPEIAKEKGIHIADIQAAIRSVRQEELQKAVEEGKLTQAQVDLLIEKADGLNFGDMGTDLLFEGFDKLQARVEQMRTVLAQTLNMSVEELASALKEKSIYEIAKEKNVHIADIQAAMQKAHQSAMKEWLQESVTDGKLTQEQADLISARIALGKSGMRPDFLNLGLRGGADLFRGLMGNRGPDLFGGMGWFDR